LQHAADVARARLRQQREVLDVLDAGEVQGEDLLLLGGGLRGVEGGVGAAGLVGRRAGVGGVEGFHEEGRRVRRDRLYVSPRLPFAMRLTDLDTRAVRFHTSEEASDALRAACEANPDVAAFEVIGKSEEGRPIA